MSNEPFVLCKRYTPAWRLFNLRYRCMATNLVEVTTEYLSSGNAIMNVSGNKQVDTLATGRMEYKVFTAAAIAMLVNEGHSIAITQLHDCIQMYADIQDHLNIWLQEARMAMHLDDLPPLEDLRAFEALALEVYRVAKRLEPRSEVKSSIFDAMVEMSRRRNLIATNRFLTSTIEKDGELKPYVSIVDEIERYMADLY